MLNIHWKKRLVLLISSLLLSVFCFGQQKGKSYNLPHYDDHKAHYGFLLAMNSSDYRIKLSEAHYTTYAKQVSRVEPLNSGSFSLAFIFNYQLNPWWALRLTPGVSFYQRSINYHITDLATGEEEVILQNHDPTILEIPLMARFQSNRFRNSRVYVVGGLKMGVLAGSKKKATKPDQLRHKNVDFSIDYGFGFDFYFQMFKFAPEIRFSHGIRDLRMPGDNNIYVNQLSWMSSHTVSLIFNFE